MKEEAILSIYILITVIQDIMRNTNLSLSFSRRDYASEFAGALYQLSEQVDSRAGASSKVFWITFAQASAGLIQTIVRRAKNPALDLARALEAGLFPSTLKCWVQLGSLAPNFFGVCLLAVVDLLPVPCVSRALASKPFGGLLDQAIAQSRDEEEKWMWGNILQCINRSLFGFEGETEIEVQMCSNLMVSTSTATLLSTNH
jgi:hypothetical protein